jgi:hypothetical protein
LVEPGGTVTTGDASGILTVHDAVTIEGRLLVDLDIDDDAQLGSGPVPFDFAGVLVNGRIDAAGPVELSEGSSLDLKMGDALASLLERNISPARPPSTVNKRPEKIEAVAIQSETGLAGKFDTVFELDERHLGLGLFHDAGLEADIALADSASAGVPFLQAPPGDANGDGVFNQCDIVQVLQSGLYETGTAADWTQGDWNHDGVFDRFDLMFGLIAGFNRGCHGENDS